MHAMDGSSMDWVMNGPGQAPAFLLAENGFDVWLGNNRGNFYSFESMNTTYQTREFWQFGPEEIGTIDLPTMIDYILLKTGESKVTYLSLQQGGQVFFMGASLLPVFFNSKVDVHIALSPRTDLSRTYGNFIAFFWYVWAIWQRMLQDMGWYDILSRDSYYASAE
jgi:lysosomal acid lipase/cholesteryl ester hydrolase